MLKCRFTRKASQIPSVCSSGLTSLSKYVQSLLVPWFTTNSTKHKMVDPSYQELNASGIPIAYPEGPDGPVKIKVISGKSFGVESPVRPLGGCWYFHVIFDKKSKIFHDLPAGWTSFAYILKGRVKAGSDEKEHKEFHTLVFSAESEQNGVSLEALEDGTELVLVRPRSSSSP